MASWQSNLAVEDPVAHDSRTETGIPLERVSTSRVSVCEGLRPTQREVINWRAGYFHVEAPRPSLAVAASASAHVDQIFIDGVSDCDDE
jgi:hypothetical protein